MFLRKKKKRAEVKDNKIDNTPEKIGDYKVLKQLGRGAFGVVYLAFDPRSGRTVAIKQVDVEGVPLTEMEAIEMEIHLLEELNSQHIVKYITSFREDDHLNIVLEYIEAGQLSTLLQQLGTRPPEPLLAKYTAQILTGLSYLHSQGVIHRDIKGANILTTKEGLIKLADFGVATRLSGGEGGGAGGAGGGAIVEAAGSPFWMAPEVIEMREGQTAACDIWSLGATLIELVTGKPPYYDTNPMAACYRIVQDPHPPLPDDMSGELEDFLLLCFTKTPRDRPDAPALLKHTWLKDVLTDNNSNNSNANANANATATAALFSPPNTTTSSASSSASAASNNSIDLQAVQLVLTKEQDTLFARALRKIINHSGETEQALVRACRDIAKLAHKVPVAARVVVNGKGVMPYISLLTQHQSEKVQTTAVYTIYHFLCPSSYFHSSSAPPVSPTNASSLLNDPLYIDAITKLRCSFFGMGLIHGLSKLVDPCRIEAIRFAAAALVRLCCFSDPSTFLAAGGLACLLSLIDARYEGKECRLLWTAADCLEMLLRVPTTTNMNNNALPVTTSTTAPLPLPQLNLSDLCLRFAAEGIIPTLIHSLVLDTLDIQRLLKKHDPKLFQRLHVKRIRGFDGGSGGGVAAVVSGRKRGSVFSSKSSLPSSSSSTNINASAAAAAVAAAAHQHSPSLEQQQPLSASLSTSTSTVNDSSSSSQNQQPSSSSSSSNPQQQQQQQQQQQLPSSSSFHQSLPSSVLQSQGQQAQLTEADDLLDKAIYSYPNNIRSPTWTPSRSVLNSPSSATAATNPPGHGGHKSSIIMSSSIAGSIVSAFESRKSSMEFIDISHFIHIDPVANETYMFKVALCLNSLVHSEDSVRDLFADKDLIEGLLVACVACPDDTTSALLLNILAVLSSTPTLATLLDLLKGPSAYTPMEHLVSLLKRFIGLAGAQWEWAVADVLHTLCSLSKGHHDLGSNDGGSGGGGNLHLAIQAGLLPLLHFLLVKITDERTRQQQQQLQQQPLQTATASAAPSLMFSRKSSAVGKTIIKSTTNNNSPRNPTSSNSNSNSNLNPNSAGNNNTNNSSSNGGNNGLSPITSSPRRGTGVDLAGGGIAVPASPRNPDRLIMAREGMNSVDILSPPSLPTPSSSSSASASASGLSSLGSPTFAGSSSTTASIYSPTRKTFPGIDGNGSIRNLSANSNSNNSLLTTNSTSELNNTNNNNTNTTNNNNNNINNGSGGSSGPVDLLAFLFPLIFRVGTCPERSVRAEQQKYKPSIFSFLLTCPDYRAPTLDMFYAWVLDEDEKAIDFLCEPATIALIQQNLKEASSVTVEYLKLLTVLNKLFTTSTTVNRAYAATDSFVTTLLQGLLNNNDTTLNSNSNSNSNLNVNVNDGLSTVTNAGSIDMPPPSLPSSSTLSLSSTPPRNNVRIAVLRIFHLFLSRAPIAAPIDNATNANTNNNPLHRFHLTDVLQQLSQDKSSVIVKGLASALLEQYDEDYEMKEEVEKASAGTKRKYKKRLVKKCMICNSEFNIFLRKHYCKNCQFVVCAACSPHRVVVAHVDPHRARRVCVNCSRFFDSSKLAPSAPSGPSPATPTHRLSKISASPAKH